MTDTREKHLASLFSNLSPERADLVVLILSSQNIKTAVQRKDSRFDVLVTPDDNPEAVHAVNAYDIENKFMTGKQKTSDIRISSFNSYTAYMVMLILTLIHALCLKYQVHEDMILQFGASSYFIKQGELYRAVTALFLHADTRHLLGNLAGMLIFAAPVISLSGSGAGSLLLLLSGTSGNLINAWMHQTARISIGASTSVMGAAGLLAAFQITRENRTFDMNRFMPLLAAAILVGLLSHGENTDITAHLFGFLCGIFYGILFFTLERFFPAPYKNKAGLIIALGIIVLSLFSGW